MAKVIMIQGTMSNVGKSLIAAGLCRIFKQDGYRVAPFKSQNMALNSYITKDNLEMGRAQAVQAEAAGVCPDVRMNPVLLKPTSDMGSQVIVMGEVVGNMGAAEYFRKKREYIPVIREAFHSLSEEYDVIVLEGAGSPAEINLKQDDIVNMGMAEMADAPVLLVGDIDRGGVFAQLVGTVMLLEDRERERIQGLIINKFRGDKKILEPGIAMLEQHCGKPVLGVVPYGDIDMEEEDSLAACLQDSLIKQGVDIAVIRLPRISNFTDFQALTLEPMLSVRYVDKLSELGNPDVVILPGTKNTIQDMRWLRESGLEAGILRLAGRKGEGGSHNVMVVGICGGYQMLGNWIRDFSGVEGGDRIRGMGLLDMDTCFQTEKTRTQMKGCVSRLSGGLAALSGKTVSGYEIHMGRTLHREKSLLELSPVANREDFSTPDSQKKADGCYRDNIIGTYLHGIFDEDEFRRGFVKLLCGRKGIAFEKKMEMSFSEYREMQYDRLAALLRQSLDMKRIYEILNEKGRGGALEKF